jgi:hypothetical protein
MPRGDPQSALVAHRMGPRPRTEALRGSPPGCGRGGARVGWRSRYSYAMAATQRLGARLEGAIPEPPQPRTVGPIATISRGTAEALRDRP